MLGRLGIAAASLACVAIWLAPAVAGAAQAPPLFAQFPQGGAPGEGAGELNQPRGIAISPVGNRHVFVAETTNRRISEFTAWGEFVKAFGWGVRDGSEELQVCTAATGCQSGLTGPGPGQFGAVPAASQYQGPTGLEVDSEGNVYAMDLGNFRVQKFDADGNFVLMFGGGVNETTSGNVCTAASGDSCVAGQPGGEDGAFGIENVLGANGDYIAVAADDSVYVADKDRIQRFDSDGQFLSAFGLPEPGNPGALAIDRGSGNLYFAFAQAPNNIVPSQPGVYRLNPAGEQVGALLAVQKASALAVDPLGNVYAAARQVGTTQPPIVVQLDAAGNELARFGQVGTQSSWEMPALATGNVGASPGDIDVYAAEYAGLVVSQINVYGATPDPEVVGDPPAVAPEIAEEFATAVGTTAATVRARINPNFWNDTAYYVEYGLQDCEVGPCQSTEAAPGTTLTGQVTNSALLSGGVSLAGLQPATTYHYRFIAQSSGGGPVAGPGRTFTTAALPPPPNTACPNQALRSGPAASLPDCRAYEMVSPVDKLGADIATIPNVTGYPAALDQAAPGGAKLTYSAYKAFADPVASPYTPQYIATRGTSGWANHSISPPRSGATMLELSALDVQFKAFSADLCEGWFLQDTDHQLAAGAVAGYPNLYRAQLCESPTGYEPITRVQPPLQKPNQFLFEVQGAGGGHTVFRANDKLTANAPAGEAAKVYDYQGGNLAYVCVLPNGSPHAGGCSAGTAGGGVPSDRNGRVRNAVSADGERIYWSAAGNGPGKLYLRSGGSQTIAISKGAAQFWGAAADGGRAIFSEGGTLYGFEVGVDGPEDAGPIAAGLIGVAGMSEDASRVYFVSGEALAGGAEAGKANLYLDEAGEGVTFIATLSSVDVGAAFGIVAPMPVRNSAHVSADGGALAFMSNNGLSGQDSREVKGGQPVAQVYLYRAEEGELVCASCNRTGARPAGRDVDSLLNLANPLWAAAYLPAWANQLRLPQALAEDGQRVFFTSFDALVLADTNGAADVYQWEAQGRGDCADPEGCISLISSGKSPQDSVFVDASASGDDVFFKTQESLLAQDPGLIDIYDARVGGGFAPPPPAPGPCQGEACQSPAPPPASSSPSSAAFQGPGNLAAAPADCAGAARQAKRLSNRAKRAARQARRVSGAARSRSLRRAARRSAKAAKRHSAAAKRCRAARRGAAQ